tara:strand:+ start:1623 stop:2015 length:393 start_codon:yes stop_codon:yes gene_type:complete
MPRSSTKKVTKKTAKKTTRKVAKKTVKKAPKKTSRKKASRTARRALVCANGEQCFWVHDGPILQDLNELATALKNMHKEVFAHHVSTSRNDFADWVEHVLQDQACATDLRSRRSPSGARTVVVRHLRYYA